MYITHTLSYITLPFISHICRMYINKIFVLINILFYYFLKGNTYFIFLYINNTKNQTIKSKHLRKYKYRFVINYVVMLLVYMYYCLLFLHIKTISSN